MSSRVKTLLILFIVTAAAIGYALTPQTIGEGQLSLKKVSWPFGGGWKVEGGGRIPEAREHSSFRSALPLCTFRSKNLQPSTKDTTRQRILFIGDSMLEGLMKRFADYAAENGHELNVVLWYSSSTERWGTTAVLDRYMKKYSPTFVVICLGSNELFVRDLAAREKFVARMVQKIDSVPFVWISPPNWCKDTGINDLIARQIGARRFFDSRGLTLERGSDHMHPTMRAAAQWMDSVAVWMGSTQTAYPILMNRPQKKGRAAHVTLLQPEYEGKE